MRVVKELARIFKTVATDDETIDNLVNRMDSRGALDQKHYKEIIIFLAKKIDELELHDK